MKMNGFAPSLIAFGAGLAWLIVATTLMPASETVRPLGVSQQTSLEGICNTATMIARLSGVEEASGIAVSRHSPDLLWTHNDSGEPAVFAFADNGTLRGRVRVAGARVDDWEDIAVGPCPEGSCLYIADIGDNEEERSQVTIYRVPEPAPTAETTAPASAITVSYPDRPQDAEALFVGPDSTLYIVTKGDDSPISIYRVPPAVPNAGARLERVATLSAEAQRDQRVTGAGATPDGEWVVLRTLDFVRFHRTSALLSGNPDDGIEVRVDRIGEPQGEGVAVLADGTIYLVGEAGDGVNGGTLARLSCKLP